MADDGFASLLRRLLPPAARPAVRRHRRPGRGRERAPGGLRPRLRALVAGRRPTTCPRPGSGGWRINLAAMADRSLRRRARALLRLGPPPLVPELSPELIDLHDALRRPAARPAPGDRPAPPGRPAGRGGGPRAAAGHRDGQVAAGPGPGGHGQHPAARPLGGDLRCTTSTPGWSGWPPRPPATPSPRSRRRSPAAAGAAAGASSPARRCWWPPWPPPAWSCRPAWPAGPADDPVPAAGPATDVSAARPGSAGYWFGKTDASVFLGAGRPRPEREAIRDRLQALGVVDRVYYESRPGGATPGCQGAVPEPGRRSLTGHRPRPRMPESFRVRLDAPEHFQRLHRALCRPGKVASGRQRCLDRVDGVVEDSGADVKALLVARGVG